MNGRILMDLVHTLHKLIISSKQIFIMVPFSHCVQWQQPKASVSQFINKAIELLSSTAVPEQRGRHSCALLRCFIKAKHGQGGGDNHCLTGLVSLFSFWLGGRG